MNTDFKVTPRDEAFKALTVREQRDIENAEQGQIKEVLLQAQSVLDNNMLTAIQQQEKVLNYLQMAGDMLMIYAPQLKAYVTSDADEEVEWEEMGGQSYRQKTAKGRLRFKDVRLRRFYEMVKLHGQIAHDAAVPATPIRLEQQVVNISGDVTFHGRERSAGDDFAAFQKAKEASSE